MPPDLLLTAAALVFALFLVSIARRHVLHSEITCRERHFSEHTARIAYGRLYTFLVGNVELRGVNNKLTGTEQSDNREKPDRYSKIFFTLVAE